MVISRKQCEARGRRAALSRRKDIDDQIEQSENRNKGKISQGTCT
jgi:hypothetical protein